MVMQRVQFFIPHADFEELKKINKRINDETDSDTKMSARMRIILKKFIKENKK
ncbi:MAG: hypothetical protein ACW990_00135 [Promethearchaeota archaeon]|jgi:hypothetical protein